MVFSGELATWMWQRLPRFKVSDLASELAMIEESDGWQILGVGLCSSPVVVL